jgi:hypothetical protein
LRWIIVQQDYDQTFPLGSDEPDGLTPIDRIFPYTKRWAVFVCPSDLYATVYRPGDPPGCAKCSWQTRCSYAFNIAIFDGGATVFQSINEPRIAYIKGRTSTRMEIIRRARGLPPEGR